MTGIAGFVKRGPADSGELLRTIGEQLRVDASHKVETWTDACAALCRVGNPVVETDRQPVVSVDGRICLLLYGECFGYEAQEQERVHAARNCTAARSDAEYVMRLFEEHGDAAFERLSGSFCIAVYDARDRSLRLVSDRLGSRPLFYAEVDGGIAFATRVSPLCGVPGVDRELNVAAVLEFCSLQKVLGSKTYHRGVRMLQPATVLRQCDGAVRMFRYWTPTYTPKHGTFARHCDELAATMESAASEISRGPERIGMLLSGGLDARMMVAAAARPLSCYSFGDYENTECEVARRVAAERGFEFTFLRRDLDHYVDMVDRAVELGSGMHPFNHAHALGFIERIATECPVVTHGYGVEALFRGTTLPKEDRSYLGLRWGRRLDSTLTDDSLPVRYHRRAYSMLGRYPGLFAEGVANSLEADIEQEARQMIEDASPHCTNVFDKLLWSDVFSRSRYTGYLFLLSLRPYVKERSTLFCNRVIDLHLRIPVSFRADDRLWMGAMARLNRGIAGIVSANTGLRPLATPPRVMAAALGRAAIARVRRLAGGSPAPDRGQPGMSPRSWPRFDWMIRNNVRLRAMIEETFSDREALPPAIFDLRRVGALLAEHLDGKAAHRDLIFALLTFGRWHKKYGV